MSIKAIILCAGSGSRMQPLSLTTPKPLIPILNKPILQWHLDSLNELVDEVLIIRYDLEQKPLQSKIDQFIESKRDNYSFKISIIQQSKTEGTGGAVLEAKEYIDAEDQVIILNGDDIYGKEDISSLIHSRSAMLACEVDNPSDFANLELDEDGNLRTIIEKPEVPVSSLINTGAFSLQGTIIDNLESIELSERGELELPDAIRQYIATATIQVITAKQWLPVGYPWDILNTHENLTTMITNKIDGEIEDNVVIKGNVSLGANSIIKSGTYIEGNVMIGEGSVIGPNAYIRGTTVIGDHSKVGFSAEVKNSTIFNNTSIPHLSYIGDSVIGNNVNIGGGSLTTNLRHDKAVIQSMVKGKLQSTSRVKLGTIIGDGVKLGGKTIIYPGRKLGADQTTLPGEVVTMDK